LRRLTEGKLLFNMHLMGKEMTIKFIDREGIHTPCYGGNTRVILGFETFEKKGNILKVVQWLSCSS
jgi:hypothetical protein